MLATFFLMWKIYNSTGVQRWPHDAIPTSRVTSCGNQTQSLSRILHVQNCIASALQKKWSLAKIYSTHNDIKENINLKSELRGVCTSKTRFLWYARSDQEGGLWWGYNQAQKQSWWVVKYRGLYFLSGAINSCECRPIYSWAENVAEELGGGSFVIGFWPLGERIWFILIRLKPLSVHFQKQNTS